MNQNDGVVLHDCSFGSLGQGLLIFVLMRPRKPADIESVINLELNSSDWVLSASLSSMNTSAASAKVLRADRIL